MAASDPVRIVDANGRSISGSNPLPVAVTSGGGEGGGASDVNVTNTELDVNVTNAELDVNVTAIARPTVLRHGQTTVATAGTEVVLGGDLALLSGVTIRADGDNTGVVYIGGATVDSTNGLILAAGDHVFLDIANVNLVYVDAATNGDSVSWIGS